MSQEFNFAHVQKAEKKKKENDGKIESRNVRWTSIRRDPLALSKGKLTWQHQKE